MQIGFDAKKIVANLTGIGNYSRGVVTMLSGCFPENKYLLFAPGKGREECTSRLRPSPNVSFVYSPHSSSLLREWWRCRGMVKDIRRAGIDLFHGLSNELPFGIRKAGCKSVVTIHDLIFLRLPETYGFLARAILKAKTRYACRHADRIIAISRQTKQDIMAFYGIPEEKISIVYQGCDRIFYRPVSDDELHDVQVKYALPSRYLLCVGTFEPRKNQLTALRALAQLDADDIRLVLVSKRTAYQAVLEKEIADLGLQQRVHVLNDVPNGDLPALYRGSHAFLYLSCFEGFGIPVLEALVSGTPVIAATGSCLEEAGGPDSLYCAPYDHHRVAEYIRYLYDHPDRRAEIIEAGRHYARRFDEKRLADDMQAVYQEVIYL